MFDDVPIWLAQARVRPDATPPALAQLVERVADTYPQDLSHNDPAPATIAARQAAVLILIATDGDDGPDVLLQQRASGLADHAGQISYPGGGRESGDASPVATALREAAEETGVDPDGVDPLVLLPRLHIPPSKFDVTGVVAHWRVPCAVSAVDPRETARVMRVPFSTLSDPANRRMIQTEFGWRGPAFLIPGAVVWGFTGEILAGLLRLGGWERPWPAGAPIDLAEAWRMVG